MGPELYELLILRGMFWTFILCIFFFACIEAMNQLRVEKISKISFSLVAVGGILFVLSILYGAYLVEKYDISDNKNMIKKELIK